MDQMDPDKDTDEHNTYTQNGQQSMDARGYARGCQRGNPLRSTMGMSTDCPVVPVDARGHAP